MESKKRIYENKFKEFINEQSMGSWSDENSDAAWARVKDLGADKQFKYLHTKVAIEIAKLRKKIDQLSR